MYINDSEIFVKHLKNKGEIDFVLIHNAGGDHRFFTHQIELLSHYGNVIQLDLPGHGNSSRTSECSMQALSSIIYQICVNLALKNICFIGLNNGANIVIDLISNHSLSLPVKSMALIDPPIFMDHSFVSEINQFIQKLEELEYQEFIAILVKDLFINTEIMNKEIAREAFLKVDRKSLQNIFKSLIEWDTQSNGRLKKINIPSLCILTDEHHCSYNKIKQEAPQFQIGKVVGSKCWPTLEVPEQINAMLERFLKVHVLS